MVPGTTIALAKKRDGSSKSQVLLAAILILVCIRAGVVMTDSVDPALTDATADWLAASAAADGLDPWEDLSELAELYGVDFAPTGGAELGSVQRIHPRTPAALLLLQPLTLASPDHAHAAMVVVTGAALVVTALVVGQRNAWVPGSQVLIASVLLTGSTAFLSTLEFGTHSAVLLLLIALVWLRPSGISNNLAGLALGLAVALRLFPALLFIPLWKAGERRTCLIGAGVGVGLNVFGALVFGLNPLGAVQAMSSAATTWMSFSGNGSLAMPLMRLGVAPLQVAAGLAILSIGVALLVSQRVVARHVVLSVVLVVALLCSPLAWEHYDLLGFLVLLAVAAESQVEPLRRPWFWIGGAWVLLQLLANSIGGLSTPEFSLAGGLTFVGRLVLLVAAALMWHRQKSQHGEMV
jgi:hypothetical protein